MAVEEAPRIRPSCSLNPKRDSRLPRVLGRDEVEALLDRIPAGTPLELRDRAMFELAYSCGLRCGEIIGLGYRRSRLRRRGAAGDGQGEEDATRPDWRARAAALDRYITSARPSLADGDGTQALFLYAAVAVCRHPTFVDGSRGG